MKESEATVRFDILTDYAKDLLRCCSLVDEDIADHALLTILDQTKYFRIATATEFVHAKKELQQYGLISTSNRCIPGLQETIARQVAENQFFKALADTIESALPVTDPVTYTLSLLSTAIS